MTGWWQVGDRSPALTVLSARELNQADVEKLVQHGAEDRDLLEGSGPALEVVFSLAGEPGPWIWRLRLHEDDVPEDGRDEFFAEELTLAPDRVVRHPQAAAARRRATFAPRLLSASAPVGRARRNWQTHGI